MWKLVAILFILAAVLVLGLGFYQGNISGQLGATAALLAILGSVIGVLQSKSD